MITFKFWLRTLFLLLVIFYHLPINLFSQTTPVIKISGYVIDSATRRPIENVNVFLSFTTLGDVTGKNGLFTIKRVPVGHYDLIVSMMGYETVNKRISLTESGIKNFNFELKMKKRINAGSKIVTGPIWVQSDIFLFHWQQKL